MLRHVALVRTDVSEEPSAFFIRVTRIGELGTTLGSSKMSVLTRATWHNIPQDTILLSHHRENLKSYIRNYLFMQKINVSLNILNKLPVLNTAGTGR
jgi:hypothetical protein